MKKYEYSWQNDIFLLHIQINNQQDKEYEIYIHREYSNRKKRMEIVKVKDEKSFRFIVSRTHPDELKFELEYPKGNIIEVFKVDDRAYYPTESFYVG